VVAAVSLHMRGPGKRERTRPCGRAQLDAARGQDRALRVGSGPRKGPRSRRAEGVGEVGDLEGGRRDRAASLRRAQRTSRPRPASS
jgi:hypothetical protein